MKVKFCSGCKTDKLISEFSLCAAKKDGLHPYCKSCAHAYYKAYYAVNKEGIKAATKISGKAYRQENKPYLAAKRAARRARENQQKPKWMSQTQIDHIEMFYEAARCLSLELGTPFEVDHIVPLNGKEVSGLHVAWNMQILPMSENRQKSNKLCA